MKTIKRSKATDIIFDLGETPDSTPTVNFVHQFGDTIISNLSTTGSGTSYTVSLTPSELNSAGINKLIWNYTVSSVAKTQSQYVNVYSQYISANDFFNRHEELETDWDDRFDEIELKVRNLVNTFCGQDFDFRSAKTLTLDGNGNRSLYLPMRLESLSVASSVDPTITGDTATTDITDLVEISPESSFYLRLKNSNSIYGNTSEVTINGDWGWPYIPQNVTDASDLILEDWMNDDSDYRKHGVQEVDIDRHRMKFNDMIYGSTGNLDADILLMDYMLFIFDMI